MECKITWNKLTIDEWAIRFKKIKRSTILQDYSYALATCKLNSQKARWGLIEVEGREAGLVQILEAGFLFNLFHAVILDRGPLWFEGFGGAAHVSAFFKEFNNQFPQRWGRKRRIIPEIETGITVEKILLQCALEPVKTSEKYQTLWWNLTIEEQLARQNLKKNWRGHLQKAEKSGLKITWDDKGEFYAWLRQIYKTDKEIRGFQGISPKLLDNLALFSTSRSPMIIGKATIDGKDIAAVLFVCHGQSATYQIGWSSEEGRKFCAHHLLLWQARNMLHSLGIEDLDLGGSNDGTAKGVKKFKQGTGAIPITLVGHYR